MSLYEMAQQLVGTLPAEFQFFYLFVTGILFFVELFVLCLPIIFLTWLVKR